MTKSRYATAYTEVLEILRYLPHEEYIKIPKEKISFFEENSDKTYNFKINPEINIEEQDISIEANTIIIQLFREYFATERQKEILNILLLQNQNQIEQEKNIKYNKLFKNNRDYRIKTSPEEEKQLVKYEENIFTKIIRVISKIFSKKSNKKQ